MPNRPRVLISSALSLDGCLDDTSSETLVLSSQKDLELRDQLRAEHDAVLVGAGTLRADNPRLGIHSERLRSERRQQGRSPNPVKVTLTRSSSLDPQLAFFQDESTRRLVFCPQAHMEILRAQLEDRASVIPCPGETISPNFLLQQLYADGIETLMIEGGQQINSLFLQNGCVDRVRIAVAPFFVGDKAAPRFVGRGSFPQNKENRMQLSKVEAVDDMAILWYEIPSMARPRS